MIENYPGAEHIDRRAETLLRFFDLSMEEKRSVAARHTNPANPWHYRGYFSNLDMEAWSHNEYFDIGPDEPFGGPDLPGMAYFEEPPVWPKREPACHWKSKMRSWRTQMNEVAMALAKALGLALGMENEIVYSVFERGNSTLRLLNYPLVPEGKTVNRSPQDGQILKDTESPVSIGSHTDAAGFSLLWQKQPGLQAQSPDGRWHDVPKIANCISVHVGDVMEAMSGGAVKATPHRVIKCGEVRQSIGFFLEPELGAPIRNVVGALRQGESPDIRDTYGWMLVQRYSAQEDWKLDSHPEQEQEAPQKA